MDVITEALKEFDIHLFNWQEIDSYWQQQVTPTLIHANPNLYFAFPATLEALSEIQKFAYQNAQSVLPCGNGSKLSWGGQVKSAAITISTQRLNRLIEHAVGDLTVTVEAGMKLAELQAILAAKGQFLPLNPSYPDTATIGGIIATADTGSWRQRYGSVRDLVLGITFVRADGEVAKAGGRVVKNVAGYDLMKLLTGSYGTLGILAQVTLRVYPQNEASKTLLLTGEAEIVAKLSQTLRASTLTPTAVDLLSTSVVEDLGKSAPMGLAVRFESLAASVTEQASLLEILGREMNLQVSGYIDNKEKDLWNRLERSPFESSILCKVGILPTAAAGLLSQVESFGWGIIHGSSGLGRLYLREDIEKEKIMALRSHAESHHGFLTVLEAPVSLKQELEVWGYTGNALEIMRSLKQKFDPKNLLSPGHFVGDI